MGEECQIEQWGQCCCSCKWRYVDRSHPGTDGKPMSNTRGYICAEPFLGYHSEWSEHGICECWIERPIRPTVIEGNDSTYYAAEAWDAAYHKRDAMPTWWRLTRKP